MAYESQLRQIQQQRQALESAQQQVSSFSPRILQTRQQLMRATPTSQLEIKRQERARAEAKQRALSQLKQAQEQFKTKLEPYERELRSRIAQMSPEYQRELYAAKTRTASRRLGRFAALGRESISKKLGELGLEPVYVGGKLIGVESPEISIPIESLPDYLEGITSPSVMPYDFAGGEALGVPSYDLARTPLGEVLGITPFEETQFGKAITQAKDQSLLKGYKQATTQLPYQYRGTLGEEQMEYIPDISAFELKPAAFAGGLARGAVIGTERLVGRVKGGWTRLARDIGVPTISAEVGTVPVAKRETITPETVIFQELPPVKIGPETVGEAAEIGTIGGLYMLPAIGTGLLGATAYTGIEAARVPIPTVSQIIEEQTSELSPTERKAYLKIDEGIAFKEDVEEYVRELKKARTAGVEQAAISGALLTIPLFYKGIRYAREPIITKGPIPKPQPALARVKIWAGEEEAAGLKVGGVYTPSWYGTVQRRWEKIIGREPKLLELAPERIEITPEVFRLSKEEATSLGLTQKVGKDTTLKQFFQTFEVQKPIEILDLSKLPKVQRYIAGKLPPRAISEDMTTFVGIGQRIKGIPLSKEGILRLERISEKQTVGRLLTRPPTPKEAPFMISFARTKPLATVKDVQLFVTETAAKEIKTYAPRATGKVSTEQALVSVERIPEPGPSTTIYGPRLLTKKQAQKLVVRAAQLTPPKLPKVKLPKIEIPIIEEESYFYYPKMVGGLGKGKSIFYGKPSPELEVATVAPQFEIPKTKFTTLEGIKFREKLGVGIKPSERLGLGFLAAGITKEVQLPAFIPLTKSFSKLREIETEVFKTPVATASALRPRLRTPTPQITRIPTTTLRHFPQRQPPPRFPTITIPIKLPEGGKKPVFFKKPKREEELFLPMIKRYGKWGMISKPTKFEKALGIAKARARETLGASIRIRRAKGGFVPLKAGEEFRFGKAGRESTILVQRLRKRLVTKSERAEFIKAKRRKIKLW